MSTEHLPDQGIYHEANTLYQACHRINGSQFLEEFYTLYRELLRHNDDAFLRRSVVFHVFAGSSPPDTCTQEPTEMDMLLMERVREIRGRLHAPDSVTAPKSTPETSPD